MEASITTLMVGGSTGGAKSTDSESCRRFSTLWTHCIQPANGPSDTTQDLNMVDPSTKGVSVQGDGILLTRPLFIMLDALVDDGTETSMFVRGWLQTLPSIVRYNLLSL